MTNENVKDWELERYCLGELPRRRIEEIKRVVQKNPELCKRIEILQQSNQETLREYPSESLIPKILERYKEAENQENRQKSAKPFGRKRFLYAVPVLAAALLIIFVVFSERGTLVPDTRIKGEEAIDYTKTQIVLYRKIADDVEILADGDQAAAGDLLQIVYVPGEKTYGVVFSIDGYGTVTLHFPESQAASTVLNQEKKVLLGSSYELDDAPGFERFFFITAMEDIDVQNILRQAKIFADLSGSAAEGILNLPQAYTQFSILLNKGEEQ